MFLKNVADQQLSTAGWNRSNSQWSRKFVNEDFPSSSDTVTQWNRKIINTANTDTQTGPSSSLLKPCACVCGDIADIPQLCVWRDESKPEQAVKERFSQALRTRTRENERLNRNVRARETGDLHFSANLRRKHTSCSHATQLLFVTESTDPPPHDKKKPKNF